MQTEGGMTMRSPGEPFDPDLTARESSIGATLVLEIDRSKRPPRFSNCIPAHHARAANRGKAITAETYPLKMQP